MHGRVPQIAAEVDVHQGAVTSPRQPSIAALAANIVEELMRYLTIVHSQVDRIALEDLAINGHTRSGQASTC